MTQDYFDGQLDYWRMYRLPDVAAFFATAATNYSSGEFSGSYADLGPEAAMLVNLKFNFTPIWYEDRVLDQLYEKYRTHDPILVYLWTPLQVWCPLTHEDRILVVANYFLLGIMLRLRMHVRTMC